MARIGVVAGVLLAMLLGGCGGSTRTPGDGGTPSVAKPQIHHRYSYPALFAEEITGGDLRRRGLITDAGAYESHRVTYRSGDLTISGVLNVPDGEGPFPAVVLAHGHIEPAFYTTGQGMNRELDYLAREGFVVLHTDYRGHAESDGVGRLQHELRLGYVRDTIAAVKALRDLPNVDPDRVSLAGRSMGGGVVFGALVTEPGLVDAAVVWASVSTRFEDNFRRWALPQRPERAAEFQERFGTSEENPRFWNELSPRTYVDRIEAAVLMHHGRLDDSCPYRWATATESALKAADVDVTLHTYEREGHTFYPDWELSMRRTVDFLRERA
jgi:dipeptidyl aminopeptidase/acylaminoacyl peptidase